MAFNAGGRVLVCRPCPRAPPSISRPLSTASFRPPKTRLVILSSVALGLGTYLAWPTESRSAPTSSQLPLRYSHFTPVTVESSEPSSLSTKLITLALPSRLLPSEGLKPIHSIYVKDDDIQVERPYTPLYGIQKDGKIRVWVKQYPHGEVGRWMHSKKPGDVIEIRGPVPTWTWEDGQWDEIVMVGASTKHLYCTQTADVLLSSRYLEGRASRLSFSFYNLKLPPAYLAPRTLHYSTPLHLLRSSHLLKYSTACVS